MRKQTEKAVHLHGGKLCHFDVGKGILIICDHFGYQGSVVTSSRSGQKYTAQNYNKWMCNKCSTCNCIQ